MTSVTLPRTSGVVRWFNDLKGFGFIQPDDSDEPAFLHSDDAEGDEVLRVGDRVSFVVEQTPKGARARHVMIAQRVAP